MKVMEPFDVMRETLYMVGEGLVEWGEYHWQSDLRPDTTATHL